MSISITPVTLKEAHTFTAEHHRHHKPSVGGLFAVACSDGGAVVGVAVIGRPVARHSQDGWTAEVTRLCVKEGHPNAASKLLGAAWRAARALGWRRLITYTLPYEGGASLRGAGWRVVGQTQPGDWNSKSRPRVGLHPHQVKIRWEA
jgi:hypothetical protein